MQLRDLFGRRFFPSSLSSPSSSIVALSGASSSPQSSSTLVSVSSASNAAALTANPPNLLVKNGATDYEEEDCSFQNWYRHKTFFVSTVLRTVILTKAAGRTSRSGATCRNSNLQKYKPVATARLIFHTQHGAAVGAWTRWAEQDTT